MGLSRTVRVQPEYTPSATKLAIFMTELWDPQEPYVQDRRQKDKSHHDIPKPGRALRLQKRRDTRPQLYRLQPEATERARIPGHPGKPRAPPGVTHPQPDACPLPTPVAQVRLDMPPPPHPAVRRGAGWRARTCAMAVGGCYLLTQQRSSIGGRQGLLGHPLADLLELVLNKVLQGGELRLAAATSVHVILICNEPAVSGAWEGFQPQADAPKGGIRTRDAFPSPPKGAENTLGSPGSQAFSGGLQQCPP